MKELKPLSLQINTVTLTLVPYLLLHLMLMEVIQFGLRLKQRTSMVSLINLMKVTEHTTRACQINRFLSLKTELVKPKQPLILSGVMALTMEEFP